MEDTISLNRLLLLHPKIRDAAVRAYRKAVSITPIGIHPFITETIRSFEESNELYQQGRTKPGSIVTNAKAGQSYHNYGLACFDDKTEILTENGFVLFKDLKEGEKVATYKDDIIRFDYPLGYISYPYNGQMIEIKTRSVSQVITPNHKLIVKRKTNRKWEENWHELTADTVDYKYKIPTNGTKWEVCEIKVRQEKVFTSSNAKNSYIVTEEYQEYPFSHLMSAETWWSFMGWFLSEGYTAGSKDGSQKTHNGRFKVSICQSLSSTVRDNLLKCMDNTGFTYGISEREVYIHSKELWKLLHPLGNCYQKYIDRYLLNAPNNLLAELYKSLIDGDGCYYEKHETYYSASKRLIDGVCELALRLGYSVKVSEKFVKQGAVIMAHGELIKSNSFCYEVATRRRITQELRNGGGEERIGRINYVGNVYCVNTNDGAVVIRREGKVSVSGNCDFVILDNGHSNWEVNDNWMKVVTCFKNEGFAWGGDFKSIKDFPHLENRLGYGWRQLLQKHNAGDFIKGTSYLNL